MNSIGLFYGFIIKEFLQTLRDKRMRVMLFVAPIAQLIIFGIAISTNVKNIRIFANITPNDYILQHIYEHCIQSKWFTPIFDYNFDYHTDPFELLKSSKIDVALVARPGGLTKALKHGSTDLQILIDATNVTQARSIENYLNTIINKVVINDLKITMPVDPINFNTRVLFNASLETSYFMVPGVMSLLLCIITIVIMSTSIAREKELGTFEMLISAPLRSSEIILGKTIPYIILGMINTPLILLVAIFEFGVPLRGSVWVLFLASLVFVCTTVAIGALISTFTRNQQQSILAGFLFLFPAILLSGMMFPLENMPDVLKWLAYLDPIAHYLGLLRNIMLKGGDPQFIVQELSILLGMTIICIYLSYKRFNTTLQ